MNLYVGITDYHWFKLHASNPTLEDVNFWKPSSRTGFSALQSKEPFLFKIKGQPYIGGGGFFATHLPLRLSHAWTSLGQANGATSLDELRTLISRAARRIIGPFEDPIIGCTLLEEPFFFERDDWIQIPDDFRHGIRQGKLYAMESGTGSRLWAQVTERLPRTKQKSLGPATIAAQERLRYGNPVLVTPRLGQGSFRVMVTDAYGYRCAMTSERTLPVLEAAHIKPYAEGGEHALSNGILLRSDLHKLFDLGYLTIEPKDKRIIVSDRIKVEYENGREYYKLRNQPLTLPGNPFAIPSNDLLTYHAENVFRA